MTNLYPFVILKFRLLSLSVLASGFRGLIFLLKILKVGITLFSQIFASIEGRRNKGQEWK
jgi:hypothetical protein